MNGIDAHSELWSFLLMLYDEAGIPDALLSLQEGQAIDVPFYLAVLHAVTTDHHITPTAISALYAEVQEWREKVIVPLRTIRKTLKVHSWATRFENTGAFRETIKSAELKAEKIEVEVLEKLIPIYFGVRVMEGKSDIFAVSLALLNTFGSLEIANLPAEAEFVARTIALNYKAGRPSFKL
ncbi:TIGR02444 family protein [Brucella sp. BE17]|uniref:TIGR02444 family protein n=1 Tax=Brucella sp. BE17 TaxID=3142977 RepID=UPI0031BBA232